MTLEQLRGQAYVQLDGGYRTWPEPLGKCCVTLEDADFLYSLVRVLKPNEVLETGTGLGVAARFIGEALKANGQGHLTTWEPLKMWADQARPLLDDLPVTVQCGDPPYSRTADLVFLDSGPGARPAEIKRWLRSKSHAVIVVHDANRQYRELDYGTGVYLPGSDGLWIGRPGR